jgi:hypothetical protein
MGFAGLRLQGHPEKKLAMKFLSMPAMTRPLQACVTLT